MKDKYKSAYAKKRATKRKSAPKRKTAPKKTTYKKRSGVVVPTKLKTSPGALSTSMWMSASKISPAVKAMEQVGVRSVLTNNNSNIFGSATGHWGCFNIPHLEKGDLASIFEELPDQGSALLQPRRYVLDAYLSDISLTNNSTGSQEVELYDVVCRKDLPAQNTFIIGLNAFNVLATPSAYICEGIAAAQGATAGTVANTALLVGTSPFDSPFFKEYFKVVKRSVLQMTPGASHRHTVSLKPNRLLKEEAINVSPGPAAGNMVCDAGFQCFTLILLRPYGSVDTTTDPIVPTTARGSLVAVYTHRYTYTQVVGQVAGLKYLTNIPVVGGADVFTAVNPLTGIVNPIVTAP